MATNSYTRTYTHVDWVDNEDVVTADGQHGFNPEFHALENEFDNIATVLTVTTTTINQIQRLAFLSQQSIPTLAGNTLSAEMSVETYDSSTLPSNMEKVYFPIIFPVAPGPFSIVPTFLYRVLGTKVTVTVTFYNPTTTAAQFSCRILSLALPVTS